MPYNNSLKNIAKKAQKKISSLLFYTSNITWQFLSTYLQVDEQVSAELNKDSLASPPKKYVSTKKLKPNHKHYLNSAGTNPDSY
jgi:hypothetical protein